MTPDLPAELQPLAALIATVRRLEARVEELERQKQPALVRLPDFPAYHQAQHDSPVPLVTYDQLRKYVSRQARLERESGVRMDWIVRDGGRIYVEPERFERWQRAMAKTGRVRVRTGVRG